MRKLAFLSVAFALVAMSFYGCEETNPAEPTTLSDPAPVPKLSRQSPASSVRGSKP